MPSLPSASSHNPPWYLYLCPWLFVPYPDPADFEIVLHEPNPPPAQIVTPPVPPFPLAIQTHVGQFLTDVQYANLVRLHIFTQAQHDILLSELSSAQLDYLLLHHVITDEQLAYQLNNNLLTINQINRISCARLFDMFIGAHNIGINNVFIGLPNDLSRLNISSELSRCFSVEETVVLNLSQKALLLHLNFMGMFNGGQFLQVLSNEELNTLIINDAITLPQLNYLGDYRIAGLDAQSVIHIINMETNYKPFINRLIFANTAETIYRGDFIYGERARKILTALLVRIVESKQWDYYLQEYEHVNTGLLLPEVLSTLDSRGNYLLTAVYLNKPQAPEDLRKWQAFMADLQRYQSRDSNNILNSVSLEAYTQWLNMVVNTNNLQFNINALSNERFLLINANTVITICGFDDLIYLAHIFSPQCSIPSQGFITGLIINPHLYGAFNQISQMSRGRQDILREVYKKLDLDKKALFVVCTQYNPSTDEGLSFNSGGAGSSGDGAPPRPPGSSNDPAPPHGSSNDETRRLNLEQAAPVLTPGLNYFGNE
ncbi:hypothetical protein, partial [Polynucleobacter sp.]|uniref:hypothetical protein n=1 Tax=Polynucleobacter sp. TaxID=2029855 RepID=UPI00333FAB46